MKRRVTMWSVAERRGRPAFVLEYTRRNAIHAWLTGFDNNASKSLPSWAKAVKVVVEWEAKS